MQEIFKSIFKHFCPQKGECNPKQCVRTAAARHIIPAWLVHGMFINILSLHGIAIYTINGDTRDATVSRNEKRFLTYTTCSLSVEPSGRVIFGSDQKTRTALRMNHTCGRVHCRG